jgi:hypothetical protein
MMLSAATQLPTSNFRRPNIPNFQLPIGDWQLGMPGNWELGVGN